MPVNFVWQSPEFPPTRIGKALMTSAIFGPTSKGLKPTSERNPAAVVSLLVTKVISRMERRKAKALCAFNDNSMLSF